MTNETTRIQPADLKVRKGNIPIVCLTAYDTPTRIAICYWWAILWPWLFMAWKPRVA
jgi:hypothetical protein